MELTIGKEFLKKYDLIPKEAMALELIGRGMMWHHPDCHSDHKNWIKTPSQWTDLYDQKVENAAVFQIWIFYPLNRIESKYVPIFLFGLLQAFLE
jgi:hypothetical protein